MGVEMTHCLNVHVHGIGLIELLQIWFVRAADIDCLCWRYSVFMLQRHILIVCDVDIECLYYRYCVFMFQILCVCATDIVCLCYRYCVFVLQILCVYVTDVQFSSNVIVFFCHHTFHEDCLPAHNMVSVTQISHNKRSTLQRF